MRDILIVIPCYNEEEILKSSVEKLHEFCNENLREYKWEIVIGDNASTDRTPIIGKELSKSLENVSYYYSPQKGRGHILRKIWTDFESKIYIYTDSDLSTPPTYISDMVKALLRDNYDVAIGSRLLKNSKVAERTFFREIISRGYNKIIRFLFKVHFHDGQCGFKGITQKIKDEIIPMVKDNYWFFDTELLILSERHGYKIAEIPISWKDRESKKSKVKVFKDSIYFLKEIKRLKSSFKNQKREVRS